MITEMQNMSEASKYLSILNQILSWRNREGKERKEGRREQRKGRKNLAKNRHFP